jgi:hypothetical protein
VGDIPNPPWPGIVKSFPSRESLVNDIPSGDGEIANLFVQYIYDEERTKEFQYSR